MVDKICKLSNDLNITLYNILLSAYNILLMKWTGQRDIIIGTASAGRQNSDCEKIIGMFVNTLPMRNYVDDDKGVLDFIKEVTNNSIDAFDNQAYQLEKLVDRLDLKRNLNRSTLFDTTFTLQNIKSKEFTINDLEITNIEFEEVKAPFAINLIAFQNGGEYNLRFEYQVSLFKKSTIKNIATNYVSILEQLVEKEKMYVKDIEFINNYATIDTEEIDERNFDFIF